MSTRKPSNVHYLNGNPGKRPPNKNEPKPPAPARLPAPPAHLSPEAKAEWKRIVPKLKKLGLLTLVDRATLAAYCNACGMLVQADKVLNAKGLTYRARSGLIKTRPEVKIAEQARKDIKNIGAQFGLSPSARAGLSVDPSMGDEEEDWLFGEEAKGGNK